MSYPAEGQAVLEGASSSSAEIIKKWYGQSVAGAFEWSDHVVPAHGPGNDPVQPRQLQSHQDQMEQWGCGPGGPELWGGSWRRKAGRAAAAQVQVPASRAFGVPAATATGAGDCELSRT